MSAAALIAPSDEAGVAAAVAAAATAGTPLGIEGNGSKRGMLRPVQAASTLSTRNLSGITLYRPQELIVSARAGTPLAELEAALAAEGQHLIAEPPDLRALLGADAPPTIGGIVASNLSGPRRIVAGAMRDHLLGIRAVNGRGEVFRSGGRVLKNVTGLDLCKLLAGSHGTLGVITEVTLKVLPKPEATATIAVRVPDHATGVRVLSAGLTSPYGVTGAALRDEGAGGLTACLRLEDFADFLPARCEKLRAVLGDAGPSEVLGHADSLALWTAIRNVADLPRRDAIWRLSVRPSTAPGVVATLRRGFDAATQLDWGGGLVWVAGPATEAAHAAVAAAVREAGGAYLLLRAPDALRTAVPVLPEEPRALAAIGRRVKAVLDPAGILNPGRMLAGM